MEGVRDNMHGLFSGLEEERNGRLLAVVISWEDIVEEFRANEVYKQEMISSRVAAITTYKGCEEF